MSDVTVKVSEYFFWSPILGTDAVRFSVFDSRGGEFWQIHPVMGHGLKMRELRQRTAERIHEAMQSGQEPGQVY